MVAPFNLGVCLALYVRLMIERYILAKQNEVIFALNILSYETIAFQ